MSVPKMSVGTPARIQRNREAKAQRFVEYFLHQMRGAGVTCPERNKEALQTAIEHVRSASREQWNHVAAELTKENQRRGFLKVEEAPSAATQVVIVARIELMVKNVDYLKAQAADDAELWGELLNQRGTGSVGAAVAVEDGDR